MPSSDLPEGWTSATIADLCDLNPRHNRELDLSLPVSFVPMASVSDEYGEITEADERPLGEIRSGYTHFAEDDVLWAKITPCMQNGKSAVARGLVNGLGCGTTEFYVLRSKGAVLPDYLHRFMRQGSYLHEAEQSMSGAVGQARVPKDFVLESEVPVPPLAEQRRIVDRLDAIEAHRRAAKEKLDRLPDLLERYRQSVLAAAFRGDLTAAWREAHPGAEPSAPEVRRTYRARWIEDKAQTTTARAEARAAKKGKVWSDTERAERLDAERRKAEKKFERPQAASEDGRPALPAGWTWMTLEEITDPARSLCYGVVQPGKEPEEGVPLIRVQDLLGERIETDSLRRIAPEIDDQFERSRVEPGDVLVSLVGTIGRVATVDSQVGYANIARAVGRVSALCSLGAWVAICLQAPQLQEWLLRESREVARKTLNLGTLAQAVLPVPPLDEAARAVARVNDYLSRSVALRSTTTAASDHVESLRQSTLARAFRGELVPTEAALAGRDGRSYEPAVALLARAERGEASQTELAF